MPLTTIKNIPNIMRSKSWVNGAQLMERWFNRLRATAPNYSEPPVTNVIRMEWVLTFARAKAVYDQLLKDQIWITDPAKREISKMLQRKNLLNGGPGSFGNLDISADRLDPDYINYRSVNYSLSDLDDLTAALGRFVLRVLVAGSVQKPTGTARYQVTIREVGIYARDSYDFNETQFLGYWDDSNTVSMTDPSAGTGVINDDFRNWREHMGTGGDFLVFSDVKRVALTSPASFELQ